MLVNPSYPDAETQVHGAQEAARGFGQQLIVLHPSPPDGTR